jgi:biopolymer transport protein ExbB/TolQ
LRRAGGTDHDVQQGMDEEALRELPKIEKRTGYLAMLGNLATLAGLLGTITGLIKSFAGVAGVDPSMKATMLSKGISEAMNCTAFGLGAGILGLATFAWLNGMTQGILDGINQVTVETLNLVVAGQQPQGHGQQGQY